MSAGSFLFGGKSKGMESGYQKPFAYAGYGGAAKLAGADVSYVPDKQGRMKPKVDWSKAWGNITPDSASQGYDWSGVDDAISKYKAGPAQLNYASLPDQYYNDQMALGAKDINRQGAGQLAKLQEAVGVRNPGRLAKLGADQSRFTGENLASMYTGLRGSQAKEKTDLGVAQQKDQANLVKDYLDSLSSAGSNKVSQQAQMTQFAKQQQMALQQQMLEAYLRSLGIKGSTQQQSNGLFGTVANAAGQVGAAYAGKPG